MKHYSHLLSTSQSLPVDVHSSFINRSLDKPKTNFSESEFQNEEVVVISLHSSIDRVHGAADTIALCLCSPVFQDYCNILYGMNSEDFRGDRLFDDDTPSQYIVRINVLFQSFADNLSLFSKGEILNVHIDSLVAKFVSRFILQACLLPHLSSRGVSRLSTDIAQFERCLLSYCQIKENGEPYQQLQAFHRLIFKDLSEIRDSEEVIILPADFVLHHLFFACAKRIDHKSDTI